MPKSRLSGGGKNRATEGREVGELIKFMDQLKKYGVNFVSLRDQTDTRTAMGKFMFHLLASLVQLGRDLTSKRTRAGMDAARKRDWHPGSQTLVQRLEKEDPKQLKALRKDISDLKMSWRGLHKKYG
ncbi:MAG: recombinase family protein [Lentilitoribacter sp.]